jgi:hypothetical protein
MIAPLSEYGLSWTQWWLQNMQNSSGKSKSVRRLEFHVSCVSLSCSFVDANHPSVINQDRPAIIVFAGVRIVLDMRIYSTELTEARTVLCCGESRGKMLCETRRLAVTAQVATTTQNTRLQQQHPPPQAVQVHLVRRLSQSLYNGSSIPLR